MSPPPSIAELDLPELNPDRYRTLRRMVESDDCRFVVAFGGGAVPGIAANLGLAYLLDCLGLKRHIDQIWGTSAGAVVGGGWASGATPLDVLKATQGLDRKGTIDVVWRKLLASVLLRPFGYKQPDGVVRGEHFRKTIAKGLKATTFETCEIPFRCIAVRDDGSMRKKVFRKGEILPAVFASMSIPGVMIPRGVDGPSDTYYDGGILEKTPLISPVAEHSRLGGGKKLVLVGTHFDNESNMVAGRGFLQRFMQSMYAMEEECWKYQLREIRERDDVTLLLLNPKLEDSSMFDFKRCAENFKAGYIAFADQLQDAKIGLSFGAI